MGLSITINGITGTSPFDVYLCQSGGVNCFYITEITTTPYSFVIPPPYDQSTEYLLKIVDATGCIITSTESL